MNKNETETDEKMPHEAITKKQVIREKLLDAQLPGFQAEFDPIEAEQLGAFIEDALSEQDALDSSGDPLSAEDNSDD